VSGFGTLKPLKTKNKILSYRRETVLQGAL